MAQHNQQSAAHNSTPRHTLFRLKAIASELRAKQATDATERQNWEELAIEWHLLANRALETRTRDQQAQGQPSRAERAESADETSTAREPQGIGYYIDSLTGAMHHVQHRR